MGIILGIVLLMILVVVHELGHFLSAKKFGVKVYEFGVGIPPKLFKYHQDKSGTEYTINAIPLGGFVRLKGEDPNDPKEINAKDSLITQKLRKKLIIIAGGVLMNLLFAFLIFTTVFTKGIKPIRTTPENFVKQENQSYLFPSYSFLKQQGLLSGKIENTPAKILQVLPDSLADKNGLMSGDIINSINQKPITTLNLSTILKKNINKKFTLTYTRNGKKHSTKLKCPQDSCLLGVMVDRQGNIEILPVKFGLIGAMGAALHEIKAETKLTFYALGKLFTNLLSFDKKKIKSSVDKMTGPVGMTKIGGIILDQSIWQYIAFGGMISLALAIFNMLPIPALDGGRAIGMIIQSLFKLKPQKYFTIENYINLVFFVLLMGFGIYIIFLDLKRFWGVNIPGLG